MSREVLIEPVGEDPLAGVIAGLADVAVATLAAQLRSHGLPSTTLDGVRTTRAGARFVGRARTLRYVPLREDLFAEHGGGFNAQKRSIESVGPGEVLVMETRGEAGAGTIGDILALRAQIRGAVGIVTDGGVRDVSTVAMLDIPVFAQCTHPAVLGRRHVPWDVDIAISCGGATVLPGDIVVGDDDGVVVIPPAIAERILVDAVAQERHEEFITKQVREGASIDGLYPPTGIWLERYEAWEAAAGTPARSQENRA